jgi:hypothetical protein
MTLLVSLGTSPMLPPRIPVRILAPSHTRGSARAPRRARGCAPTAHSCRAQRWVRSRLRHDVVVSAAKLSVLRTSATEPSTSSRRKSGHVPRGMNHGHGARGTTGGRNIQFLCPSMSKPPNARRASRMRDAARIATVGCCGGPVATTRRRPPQVQHRSQSVSDGTAAAASTQTRPC